MPLTPDEITAQEFEPKLRGIDPEEVAEFLERVAEEFNNALASNQSLEEHVESLNTEINSIQNKEKEFHSAILSMHKSSEELKQKSEEEAKKLVADAKEEAKTLRTTATEEVKEQKAAAKQETDELRKKTKEETSELSNKTNQEVKELREKAQQEADTLKEDARHAAEELTAKTTKEANEQRDAARKETQELLAKTDQEITSLRQKAEKEITDMKQEAAKEVGALQERHRVEKERLDKELGLIKTLRETISTQMREFLQSHLDRLDDVDLSLEEKLASLSAGVSSLSPAAAPPPEPPPKPEPKEPEASSPPAEDKTDGGMDDLTSPSASTEKSAPEKDFSAMDVDDLTGLYEKVDLSDLGGPGQGSDDLQEHGERDLSLDGGIIEDLS